MKKNVFYSVMAMFMMLFVASCSQDEIVSVNQPGDGMVRLSVNVSGATPTTRADISVPNYTMQCIMEIRDASGSLIGSQLKETVDTSTGTVTFSYNTNDYPGASQYLFWAQYLDGEGNAFYKTSDLTKVTFDGNKKASLFNNEAVDAFCASVDAVSSGSTNVTLKRPLSRIAVKTEDMQSLIDAGYTTITPSINGANVYNVSTKSATDVITLGLGADETLTVADGNFCFYCYVFTGSAITKNTTISFVNASEEKKTITLEASEMINIGSNSSVTLVPAEDPDPEEPGENIEVSVSIDDLFEGEERPAVLEVGAYINASGEPTNDADEAIAVVYAMAGAADNSTYGDGKTVAAYAISLNKATNRNKLGEYSNLSLSVTDDANNAYAGYTFSNAIKTALSTVEDATAYQMFDSFFNSSLVPATASEKLSEWYIPSIAQLQAALGQTNEKLVAALKGAYTSNYYCASSTVTAEGVQGVIYNIEEGSVGKPEVMNSNASAVVFPVVTIFE